MSPHLVPAGVTATTRCARRGCHHFFRLHTHYRAGTDCTDPECMCRAFVSPFWWVPWAGLFVFLLLCGAAFLAIALGRS